MIIRLVKVSAPALVMRRPLGRSNTEPLMAKSTLRNLLPVSPKNHGAAITGDRKGRRRDLRHDGERLCGEVRNDGVDPIEEKAANLSGRANRRHESETAILDGGVGANYLTAPTGSWATLEIRVVPKVTCRGALLGPWRIKNFIMRS